VDYDQAVLHFKIAQGLGFEPIESQVELGWTYFKKRDYYTAEQCFRDAMIELRKRRNAERRKKHTPPDNNTSLSERCELSLKLNLYRAFAFAERGVRLHSALNCTRRVELLIPQIDSAKRRNYYQWLHDCRGWIFLRAEQLGVSLKGKLSAQPYQDAIRELEQAVALTADSEAYLHLAQAYLGRARVIAKDGTDYIALALNACEQARHGDLRGEYKPKLDDLEKQLNRMQSEIPK